MSTNIIPLSAPTDNSDAADQGAESESATSAERLEHREVFHQSNSDRRSTLLGTRLLPQHYAELQRSGLSDETIIVAGIYSESRATVIGRLINHQRYPQRHAPAIVIPFPGTDYHRVKPDTPRVVGGTTVKYESPRSCPNEAYIPDEVASQLQDAAIDLILTEGEKKTLFFPAPGVSHSQFEFCGVEEGS